MCGIAAVLRVSRAGGVVPPGEHAIPERWLDILDNAIAHRGPDGRGRLRHRAVRARDGATVDVALVHRRLSILDHGGGRQPMTLPGEFPAMVSREGGAYAPAPIDLAVIFNGCIYNHRALRRELVRAGRRFASDHSDTEVLLHGWRAWGVGMCSRLDGMWAAALWDPGAGELVLTRDLAHEKPLYLWRDTDADGVQAFVACSSAAGILRLVREFFPHARGRDRAAHLRWLRFGWGEGPFAGVHEAPMRAGARRIEDCFHGREDEDAVLPQRSERAGLSEAGVDRLIEESVRDRLDADVPVGVFLSGGIDSTLVAAAARRVRGEVRTYCVKMPDARYDESQFAAAVAAHLGTLHATIDIEGAARPRPLEDLHMLIEQLGLPLGDSSILPTAWVSRAAREHATVALGGDGGDELFAGYERHVAAHRFAPLRSMLRYIPPELYPDGHAKSRRSKVRRLLHAVRHGSREMQAIFPQPELAMLVGEDAAKEASADDEGVWISDGPADDFRRSMPLDILRKTDTASMAAALELRAPLLSRAIVNVGLSAPLEELMPGGERKGFLRMVASRHVPDRLLDRPKMGFALPIGNWFRDGRHPLRSALEDVLASRDPFPVQTLGFELRTASAAAMLREHAQGQRDHAQRLFMLLVLGIWCRMFA